MLHALRCKKKKKHLYIYIYIFFFFFFQYFCLVFQFKYPTVLRSEYIYFRCKIKIWKWNVFLLKARTTFCQWGTQTRYFFQLNFDQFLRKQDFLLKDQLEVVLSNFETLLIYLHLEMILAHCFLFLSIYP